MLRIISIFIFLVLVFWLIQRFQSNHISLANSKNWLILQINNKFRNIKNSVYFVAIVCVAVLAITGFIPFLILGKPLSGFTLLLHVTVSPVFAVCMVVLTLNWAHRHRFTTENWQWIKLFVMNRKTAQNDIPGKNDFLKKLFFWLIVFFSLTVISIVLSMYPVFGTIGQEFFLTLHKFGAVMLTVFGVLHTCILINNQHH